MITAALFTTLLSFFTAQSPFSAEGGAATAAPAPLAVLFSRPPAAPSPVSHERDAVWDGTPLEVKSQKLKQPGPKLYPSGFRAKSVTAARRLVVDIKAQRAWLFIGDGLAFETPVSTGAKGRRTPRGTFTITEKIRQGKRSTLYKCAMPFWNRLDESAFGLHTGQLPGYPASHGCIRLPGESARFIFEHAPKGTVVQIVDELASPPQPMGGHERLMAAK